MKTYAHRQTLAPIEPDESIKPDMSFSDRMPLDGVSVREVSVDTFVRIEAAHKLYHQLAHCISKN